MYSPNTAASRAAIMSPGDDKSATSSRGARRRKPGVKAHGTCKGHGPEQRRGLAAGEEWYVFSLINHERRRQSASHLYLPDGVVG